MVTMRIFASTTMSWLVASAVSPIVLSATFTEGFLLAVAVPPCNGGALGAKHLLFKGRGNVPQLRPAVRHVLGRTTRRLCEENTEQGSNHQDEYFVSSDSEPLSVDQELRAAPINVRKQSLLFGERPSTVADNEILHLWRAAKVRLPAILTGARRVDTADENPIGGLYNMIFVRLPTLLAGLVYGKNVLQGHPLVVDIGDGPFIVHPLLVGGILYAILR
jgi:hypothetical protein